MEFIKTPQGEFKLNRYPSVKKDVLQAWDAADEYLLNFFYDNHLKTESDKIYKILIINDSFGALTCSLAQHGLTIWTDSWLSEKAIENNLIHNNLSSVDINVTNSLDSPEGQYDFILLKTPKSHALLEEQLIRLKSIFSSNTKLIAAGMAKSIHTSTLKLFEKYIGVTKTSLAKKKARLIFPNNDPAITEQESVYPKDYILENTGYKIINHANVFSRDSLDIGTRFFLQHIPKNEKYKKIIDLACGNGVVGLIALEKNPDAEILFVDESYMAVASAKENINFNVDLNNVASFKVSDGLDGEKNNSADLILNNPPFHQNNAIGDDTAWRMFRQSYLVLKQHGELWVIGNRHLGYHVKLKKIFKNCEIIAANKKFCIMKAIKQ